MESLSTEDNLYLQRSYRDAVQKVAALPARFDAEFRQAEQENREPYPITPLTGIRADLVLAAIRSISGKLSMPVADVVSIQRKSCVAAGNETVFLLSADLKAILEAAGVKEQADAPIEG